MATEQKTKLNSPEPVQVHRTLTLASVHSPEHCQAGIAVLSAFPAVNKIGMTKRGSKIQLRYDANQLNIDTVISVLHECHCAMRNRWQDRVRLSWYRYVDKTANRNAVESGQSCCSSPTSEYTSQQTK